MTAASSERAGIFHTGANLPAMDAAAREPRMIPMSMTVVTSCAIGAFSTLACFAQYGHEATSMPSAMNALAPHNANADVTPHGRPANASVA